MAKMMILTFENSEKYEREKAENRLLMTLLEAEEAVKGESAWLSLDELKKSVGVQPMIKLRINLKDISINPFIMALNSLGQRRRF